MANYTKTKELPSDPRYVDGGDQQREVARTNADLKGLIAAYNTHDTANTAVFADDMM